MAEPDERVASASLVRPWTWPMHWQVLAGILVGAGLGALSGKVFAAPPAELASRLDLQLYALGGSVFLRALKMLVVPIVVFAIVTSTAGLGGHEGFARLTLRALGVYAGTGLLAILLGVFLVNAIRPGDVAGLRTDGVAAAVGTAGSAEAAQLESLEASTEGRGTGDLLHVFEELVPANLVDAAANDRMLGLIVIALLMGYFVGRLEGPKGEVTRTFFEGMYDVFLGITLLVLRFLPLGVTCLIASTTARTVADGSVGVRLTQLGWFALTVLTGLGIHMFVTMALILRFLGGVSPRRHFRAMAPALLTAFSTASSAATLPLTLESVEGAGVSKRVTSFVLPVGASINTDGTALYECVAVLFLAQLSGVDLTPGHQVLVVAMALLTSIGVAGIPSASLVAILIILDAVNARLPAGQHIPEAALALVLVFDRLLDMCRTAVNVFGDTCVAVLVARLEGEAVLSIDGDASAAPRA